MNISTYKLLDFKQTSSKDLFLLHLKGLLADFGNIRVDDQNKFLAYTVKNKFLKFCYHKEYRGILAFYEVQRKFHFRLDRLDHPENPRWVTIFVGDCIVLTEQMIGDQSRIHEDGHILHYLYTDVTDEERAVFYAK